MRPARRILAVLERALAVRDAERCGVAFSYRPLARRRDELPILDYADLRPGEHVSAVLGLAKLLRLLREARVSGAGAWVGEPEAAVRHLAPALGREFRLEVAPRSRVRFEAWTEDGALVVDDVSDIASDEEALFVRRFGPHAPVRIDRSQLIRRSTHLERWLEVRSVERRPA